jgi:hypothetical protein
VGPAPTMRTSIRGSKTHRSRGSKLDSVAPISFRVVKSHVSLFHQSWEIRSTSSSEACNSETGGNAQTDTSKCKLLPC